MAILKNVPLRMNIGVTKRKVEYSKWLMVGEIDVKHIAIDENNNPARKDIGESIEIVDLDSNEKQLQHSRL